jgi:glucuronoarabinoxylan endo-1,4-beta-xylanase
MTEEDPMARASHQSAMAEGWPLVVAIALLSLAMAASWAQTPVQITVDGSQKFQTMDGFGTAMYLYESPAPYRDKRIQEMYAVDLRNSLLRMETTPNVLKEKIDNVEEVSWQKFNLDREDNLKSNLEFARAVSKLNPRLRFTPSIWSPPGWMKDNNRPTGGGHLLPQYYPHYAKYLAEWVKFVKAKYQTDIYAIGVQNELEFSEFYCSCQYTPATWRDMLIEVHKRFQAEGIKTKIFGPESMTGSQNTPLFIRAVVEDPRAKGCLDILATHGYSDGIKMAGGTKSNSALWDVLGRYRMPLWMTETSGVRGDLATSLRGAAMEIHNSMVYGQVSAWIYWQYVNNRNRDNPNDLMTATVRGNGPQATVTGIFPAKKYYLHKHFSRFIQPGAVRMAATPADSQSLAVSAFEHAEDKTVTIELINAGSENRQAGVTLKTNLKTTKFEVYRTSATEDCAERDPVEAKGGKLTIDVPAQSMVTLYGKEN